MLKALTAVFVAACLGPGLGAARADAATPSAPPSPSVVWTGDSYPAGTGADVPLSTGYSKTAATAMNWRRGLDAQGGTGFTTAGPNPRGNRQAMPDRLPADFAKFNNPTYVVIDGGRHDGAGQTALDAAGAYYRTVRQAWPNSTIVLVVPWEVISPRINGTAHVWHDFYAGLASADAKTVVIDPVAEGWFPTDPAEAARYKMPGADVHPNQAGHDLAAQRYVQDFRAFGF